MRNLFWGIVFVLLLNMPVWAENIQPHLTVNGTATIEVTPDEMYWTLRVGNVGSGVEALVEQHSHIVQSALLFIGEAGVAKEDTRTSMMQFGENWTRQNGTRVREGYFASSMISFKLIDFIKYQHLWTGLSKIKDMSIQDIGYGYSKSIEVQDKARVAALLAAGKKARTMAKTLNVVLGNPLVIEDDPSFAEPLRSNMLMASAPVGRAGSQNTGGYALGKIEIKSRVRVVYQLTSPRE